MGNRTLSFYCRMWLLIIAMVATGELSFAENALRDRLQGARSSGQLANGQLTTISEDQRNKGAECPSGTHPVMDPRSPSGVLNQVCVLDGREDQCSQAGFEGNGYTSCIMSVGDPVKATGTKSAGEDSAAGVGCAEYQSLAQECSNKYTSTESTCDPEKDNGMNSAAGMASQVSLAFGQQTASSIQAACSGMGKVSAAANAALAGFRMTCSNSINSCQSSCSKVVDYLNAHPACASQGADISAAKAQVASCTQFNARINEANQAMMNVGQTLNNAAQCEAYSSAYDIPEICKTNPNLPTCKNIASTNCNDPSMASNKVCICVKNPGDPACSSAVTQSTDMASSGPATDPASRMKNQTAASSGDDPGLPSITPGKYKDTGAGGAVDGRQGGSANIASGGGGSGGSDSRGGGGGDSESTHGVLAGFYGGGGGSGMSGSGGYGGGGSGYGSAGRYGPTTDKSGVPNLRQFLPGGKFDRQRGIAGASGPDGITGPHSNIWQKVNNRYRTMAPTLLP